MTDALKVIKDIISQHIKINDDVNLAEGKMNDIDAVFSANRSAYKVAWSVSSLAELFEKRDKLLQTINIMDGGLKKHFKYEEKVMPLVFGELLMKDILHDHNEILAQIEKVKTCFKDLERLNHDELLSKRVELLQSVNDLRKTVVDHAQSEEKILSSMKEVIEAHR